MPKSKTSAFLSVLIVFLSGVAMGAVGYRLYAVKSVSIPVNAAKPSPEEVRKKNIADLKDKVQLDDTQVDQVHKVYQEQHEAFDKLNTKYQAQIDALAEASKAQRDQIHDASVAKIKAFLRPDQIPLYDKWTADRAAAFAKWRKEHPDRGRRPDGRQRPSGQQRPLPPLP